MSQRTGSAVEGAEPDAELMPRETPPRVARALSNFLIAVFLGVLAFAAFVPLPEAVKCRFVLAPEGGSAPVASREAGVVDQVLVQVGESVVAGQPLMSIVPYVEPASSPAELRARVDRLQAEIDSSDALDDQLATKHDFRVEELRADVARARDAEAAALARLKTLEQLTEQAQRAVDEGAMSRTQLLERKGDHEEAGLALAEARRRASAATRSLEAVEAMRLIEISERALVKRRLQGELAETEASLLDMAQRSGGESPDVVAVHAPHDGVIVAMPVERPGIVVERGQALVLIARPGARLRAEILVPERGAARISQGQIVRLLFDAYPYTQHGVLEGVLTWVSPAAQGGNLMAIARLEDATVVVDDQRRALLPGMGGEARIDIGSRTLLEYVFEPLQRLREALRPGSSEAG